MLKPLPCLLIAALMLSASGCATRPSTPTTMPPLDQSLAAPCQTIEPSEATTFDGLEQEALKWLEVLADCAARHRRLVAAWPR